MFIIYLIPWLIAVVTLIGVISIVLVSWKNGISPMPTSSRVRQVVIQEVNRIPGYGDVLEAGSGWGTLGLDVVRHCPGKRLTGIENSRIPLWSSQLIAYFSVRLRRAKGKSTLSRAGCASCAGISTPVPMNMRIV